MTKQEEFNNAVYYNDFNKVKMLLKINEIDPSDELLWQQQIVRNTLQKDNFKLFLELTKKKMKNKIQGF
jgi:hypothetical protein